MVLHFSFSPKTERPSFALEPSTYVTSDSTLRSEGHFVKQIKLLAGINGAWLKEVYGGHKKVRGPCTGSGGAGPEDAYRGCNDEIPVDLRGPAWYLCCLARALQGNDKTMNRLLAILMMASLLVPGARWASSFPNVTACACPPSSCACEGHHHAFGHGSTCAMAYGGKCAVESSDAWMRALASNPVYVCVKRNFTWPLNPSPFSVHGDPLDRLPGHTKPPVPPPRASA